MRTTLAGAAGVSLGGCATGSSSLVRTPPPDEDGYRLWLRYASPGAAARGYESEPRGGGPRVRARDEKHSCGRRFCNVRSDPQ